MTDETPAQRNMAEVVQKAREWMASDNGRQVIQKVVEDAVRAQGELKEARRVDPESLNKPVNL